MARTIEVIQAEIIAYKETQPDLAGLTSTSATAIWRLWTWVVASAIYLHETYWDAFRAEVDAIVAAAIPGTARWYQQQSLLYQHGDELSYVNEKFIYPVIDPEKQIVKRAAVSENQGMVFFKVAKLSNNIPTKLSTAELNGFSDYIQQIKFAGTQAAIISLDGDLVQINVDIYYNPSILDAEGKLIADPTVYPVTDAVNMFLANIPYDGKLYASALVDAIQSAPGVNDVVLTSLLAKTAADAAYTTVNRVYNSASGYYIVNRLTPTYYV